MSDWIKIDGNKNFEKREVNNERVRLYITTPPDSRSFATPPPTFQIKRHVETNQIIALRAIFPLHIETNQISANKTKAKQSEHLLQVIAEQLP